jgi:hypothetical protein
LQELNNLSNPLELGTGHFPGQLCRPQGNNRDPTV